MAQQSYACDSLVVLADWDEQRDRYVEHQVQAFKRAFQSDY